MLIVALSEVAGFQITKSFRPLSGEPSRSRAVRDGVTEGSRRAESAPTPLGSVGTESEGARTVWPRAVETSGRSFSQPAAKGFVRVKREFPKGGAA